LVLAQATLAADAAEKEHNPVPGMIKNTARLLAELKALRIQLAADFQEQAQVLAPQFASALAESRQLKVKFEAESADTVKRYQKEVALRKQYYNTIQELKGNIRVFVRVRKDNRGEYKAGGVFQFPSKTELLIQQVDASLPPKLMDFARVFDVEAQQPEVFNDTKPVMLSVIDGYNVCIMAYGWWRLVAA
jgi:kinesin family protein C2/C3